MIIYIKIKTYNMKIKNGFELRNVCGENVIIAHGVENIDFTKVITTNLVYRSPELRGLPERIREFRTRCLEFVSVFASAGGFRSRAVTSEDLEGVPGGDDGLLEEYKCWFGGPLSGTDIAQRDGTYLDRDSRRLFSHSFTRTDDMPGEVSNTMKVRSLSGPDCDILLSSASPLGSGLPYEHVVNAYYLYPNQQRGAVPRIPSMRRVSPASST